MSLGSPGLVDNDEKRLNSILAILYDGILVEGSRFFKEAFFERAQNGVLESDLAFGKNIYIHCVGWFLSTSNCWRVTCLAKGI
jgi:hypothetical protein